MVTFFTPEGWGFTELSESDLFRLTCREKGFFSRAAEEIVKASESRCSTFFPPLAAFCGSVGPVCRDIDPIAARAFSGSQRWKWLCCNFRLASHVRARNTTFTRSTADGQNGRSVAFFGCSDHVFLFLECACACVKWEEKHLKNKSQDFLLLVSFLKKKIIWKDFILHHWRMDFCLFYLNDFCLTRVHPLCVRVYC